MEYTKREVSRDLVRAEVLNYLRENRDRFVFSGLGDAAIAQGNAIAAGMWHTRMSELGADLPDFVDEVHQRLHSSGKVSRISVSVNDSVVASTCDLYETTRITYLILEEIVECIHSGVLIELAFRMPARQTTGSLDFRLGEGRLVLTEFGYRFVENVLAVPHSTDEYIDVLRRTQEPDDELMGYLSEGLPCLRHRLSRAAAVLLRLAAEHTLDLLIDQMRTTFGEGTNRRQQFDRRINRARRQLEDRAEEVFRRLETAGELVPDGNTQVVANRLRAAFHSIRDLGGRAAHFSESILLSVVRDHYTLFASSVFPIMMGIIEHQTAVP